MEIKEYLKEEVAEILSAENKWFTGIKLGRDPTEEECAWHYVLFGGADSFRRRGVHSPIRPVQSERAGL